MGEGRGFDVDPDRTGQTEMLPVALENDPAEPVREWSLATILQRPARHRTLPLAAQAQPLRIGPLSWQEYAADLAWDSVRRHHRKREHAAERMPAVPERAFGSTYCCL